MERVKSQQRHAGTTPATDPGMRMTTRPASSSNVFGDPLLASSSSQSTSELSSRKRRPASRSSKKRNDHDHVEVDSDSDDPLDSLSEAHSQANSPEKKKLRRNDSKRRKENEVEDTKFHHVGKQLDHETKPKNMRAIKISKNKPGVEKASSSRNSGSIEILSCEDTNISKPNKWAMEAKHSRERTDAQDATLTAKPKPKPKLPAKPSNDWDSDPPPAPPSRKPRPRPVPKMKPVDIDSSPEPKPTRGVAAAPFPMTGDSPSRRSPKAQPAPFPSSPRRSGSLTPPPVIPITKKKGKEREPAKFPLDQDPRRRSPCVTPPSQKSKGKKNVNANSNSKTNSNSKKAPMPATFPMKSLDSSQRLSRSGSKGSGSSLRGKARKMVMTDTEDESDTMASKAAPFPMTGSPFRGGLSPSKPRKKRHSSGYNSDDLRSPRKKSKADESLLDDDDFEEESSFFISPTTDPKTLCPYCDNPLPPTPSPTLLHLLEAMAKKSLPDPRPANPLGRKAPFTAFISLCQRHKFESEILPEAEAKGWPETIDWKGLEGRIAKMRDELQALIDDDGRDDEGPRNRCEVWSEIMEVVKKKGSRAATGVKDQFANFEKTQPGYYGELGSFIIHQTLYNLFPPASIPSSSIHPLNAEEFIQRVLIPEVALRLIMQDKHLPADANQSRRKALQILRESSTYGVAMFPADAADKPGAAGGKKGMLGNSKEGLTAGESILMERARKRRKEIEEEERREEEEQKRLEREKEQARLNGVRKPKPKPRPIPKGGSSASTLMDIDAVVDVELGYESPIEVLQYDTDPMEGPSRGRAELVDESDAGSAIGGRSRGRAAGSITLKKRRTPSLSSERSRPPSRSKIHSGAKKTGKSSSVAGLSGWSSDEIEEVQEPTRSQRRSGRGTQRSSSIAPRSSPDRSSLIDLASNDDDHESALAMKTPRLSRKKKVEIDELKFFDDGDNTAFAVDVNATPKPSKPNSTRSHSSRAPSDSTASSSSASSSRVATVGARSDPVDLTSDKEPEDKPLAPLERARLRKRKLEAEKEAASRKSATGLPDTKMVNDSEDDEDNWKTSLLDGHLRVGSKGRAKQKISVRCGDDNTADWLFSSTESEGAGTRSRPWGKR